MSSDALSHALTCALANQVTANQTINTIGLMACLAHSGPSILALINALDSAPLAASSAADAAGVCDSRGRRPFDCPHHGVLKTQLPIDAFRLVRPFPKISTSCCWSRS